MNLGVVNAERSESRWGALGAPSWPTFTLRGMRRALLPCIQGRKQGSGYSSSSRKSEGGWFLWLLLFSQQPCSLLNFYSGVYWKARIYSQFSLLSFHNCQLLFFSALWVSFSSNALYLLTEPLTNPRGTHYSDFLFPIHSFSTVYCFKFIYTISPECHCDYATVEKKKSPLCFLPSLPFLGKWNQHSDWARKPWGAGSRTALARSKPAGLAELDYKMTLNK